MKVTRQKGKWNEQVVSCDEENNLLAYNVTSLFTVFEYL